MQELILNPKKSDCVAKPLTPAIFSILREYTGSKNNVQLGELMDIKSPGVAISQMKRGTINLRVEKLQSLASKKDISYDNLIGIICNRMLIVSAEDRRKSFLIGLQGASALSIGSVFQQKINGQEAAFLQTGSVPPEWFKLVPDQADRIRMITDYCISPERFDLKGCKSEGKKAPPPPRKDSLPPPETPTALAGPQESGDGEMLFRSINEMQLVNAISQASQNVGEARRFKLSMLPEILIGTLVNQMLRRNYSINIEFVGKQEVESKVVSGKVSSPGMCPKKEDVILYFHDKEGKAFSWKLDFQCFLSNKLKE